MFPLSPEQWLHSAAHVTGQGEGLAVEHESSDDRIEAASSQPGVDPGGIWRDGVYAHGDYPRVFQDAAGQPQLRMSGYNMAAIAAGLPQNTVGPPVLPPILGGSMPGAPGPVPGGRR